MKFQGFLELYVRNRGQRSIYISQSIFLTLAFQLMNQTVRLVNVMKSIPGTHSVKDTTLDLG